MATRRRIVVLGGAMGIAACSTPTQPIAPNLRYEISFAAEASGTVAQALRSHGHELEIDANRWAQMGQLVFGINEASGNWRMEVNGEWFGPDVTQKRIVPGDQIGCWRQSVLAAAFDRWLYQRTQAL